MPSLNPITPIVLSLIVIFILIFVDLILTNIELARAEECDDFEKSIKLKNSLSTKIAITIISLTFILVINFAKFIIFLMGHFHRIS